VPSSSEPRSFPPAARPLFVGVVHLLPTPGSPRYDGSTGRAVSRACEDARALAENGCDAILVENYGDFPFFPAGVPPETIAALTLCASAVIGVARSLPVGVNVLRNDARSALGICAATGASFVRVNVHAGVAATDQGILEGRAHETLRERARLCPRVAILADAHVKHATPLGRETLAQAVRDLAVRALADVVIVSGPATGVPPSVAELREAREAAGGTPVLVGSGLSPENAPELLRHADGAIVGTALERDGRTGEPVEVARVQRMRRAFDALRS